MTTGTKGLMLWCKNITGNYGGDVEIKNMTSSWKNGLAFCAILHHYRPDLIDFGKLSKENIAENNELAFRVAETELGIPALLDVEDMVNMRVPDRLSILTYVSQYYNYFKDKVPGEIVTHRIPSKKRPNTEEIQDIPVKVIPGNLSIRNASEMNPAKASACFECGKTVYLMERLSVEGKLFHRVCFKCSTCNIQLKTSTYDFDKREQRFYCDKHFKNIDTLRLEPEGKEGLSDMQKDVLDEDAPTSRILNSPFVHNDQQAKSIGPQLENQKSTRVAVQWEKSQVIKSKEEEHKPQLREPKETSRSFLGSVLKRKSYTLSSDNGDFANPAYQQHLDLSNFMNQLNSENNKLPVQRVVVGTEKVGTVVENKNDLGMPDKSITKSSGECEEASKKSSDLLKGLNKKKFVLKIKKKKKKQDEFKDICQENTNLPSVTATEDKKPENLNKNYENIDDLVLSIKNDVNSQDDEVVYDNSQLCNAVCKSQPVEMNEKKVCDSQEADSREAIYHAQSDQNEQDRNQNQFLLAETSQLSDGRQVDLDEDTNNDRHTESQYSNIRSNLRKVENIHSVSNERKETKTDSVGMTFLNVRAKLNKTGLTDIKFENTEINEADEHSTLQQSDNSIEYMRDHVDVDNTPVVQRELVKVDIDENLSGLENKTDKEDSSGVDSQNPFVTPIVSPDSSPTMNTEIKNVSSFDESPTDPPSKIHTTNPFEDSSSEYLSHEDDKKNPFEDSLSKKESCRTDDKNPFEDSDDESVTSSEAENKNPFLDCSEDILFESDQSDDFDKSNPFAEDVKQERKNTLSKRQRPVLIESNKERMSLKQKNSLKYFGIDESNPFADDVLEDIGDGDSHLDSSDNIDIHVPQIKSHLPKAGGKKLLLKTKNGNPLFLHAENVDTNIAKPKKRSAPRPPSQLNVAGNVDNSSPTVKKGTLTKRQAPSRPCVLPEVNTIIANKEVTREDSNDTNNTIMARVNSLPSSDERNITGEDITEESNEISVSVDSQDVVSPLVSPSLATSSTPTRPSRNTKDSEKRKAPARPKQPFIIDEESIMKGVALRDKQPNRTEMEAELKYLEIRQRELEMEGVVMEKKLRECSGDEPEEAYLLTWFELVNQKNMLLRRENELIYLCQEQDFLRNQRRAEFELRQLMSKPEHERTIDDRMREEELLADILNFVTRRSNIVDQMDEDRIREYEEDQEINSMMEAQKLTSSPQKSIDVETSENKVVNNDDKNKSEKKKVKKEKNKSKAIKTKKK